MRVELKVLLYRVERRIALFPFRRATAVGVGISAGAGCLVAGLVTLDHPLRSFPLLLGGIGGFVFAACLWEME